MATYLCLVAGRLDDVLTSLVVDDESGVVRVAGRTPTGPRPMPVVADAPAPWCTSATAGTRTASPP